MTRVTVLAALAFALAAIPVFAQEPKGVIYDFTATWCGPCQQMAPIVEKLQREGVPIRKIDVDQHSDLVSKFQVTGMPTFVLVVEGKEVERRTGRMAESELRTMAARIPTSAPQAAMTQPAVSQGAVSQAASPRSSGVIPIELGQPAPLVRPAPIATAQPETRVAEAEPRKSGLRDLLPFGRKKAEETPEVIRGNDSPVGRQELTSAAPPKGAPVDPMEASVRIRVITNGRIDLGSGTVVSSEQGLSRILTCAHIFKGFTDDSRIEVDVFENNRPTQYLARLIKYDEPADVGLISIPTTMRIRSSKIATVEQMPKVGDQVAAIGCSGGDDPTRQQSRITDIDKYEGPHNLLCMGVPVRGRSGGGLFNSTGDLIGVCSAADEDEQRGFYSGLQAIHKLLDENGLASLYKSTPAVPEKAVAASAAETPARPAVPEAKAVPFEISSAGSPFASTPAAAPASVPVSVPTSLVSSATRGGGTPLDVQAGQAEVVVIIRDPNQPQASNRVVILHQASPKFLSYLTGELKEDTIDSGLLGANGEQHVPEVTRTARTTARQPNAFPAAGSVESKQVLTPTTISQPVIPTKYSRAK